MGRSKRGPSGERLPIQLKRERRPAEESRQFLGLPLGPPTLGRFLLFITASAASFTIGWVLILRGATNTVGPLVAGLGFGIAAIDNRYRARRRR